MHRFLNQQCLPVKLAQYSFLGLMLMLTSAGPTAAQRYKTDPTSPDYRDSRKLKSIKRTKKDVASGKQPLSGNQADLEKYLVEYFFPSMTDPKMAGKLADMRFELTRDLAIATGDAHQFFVSTIYKQCRTHLSSKYAPAVRYNCALLLGDLNESEANATNGTPPVPFQPALKDLAKLLGSAKTDDATLVASLIGIRRHALLSGPKDAPKSLYREPKIQGYLISKLGRLASNGKPPAGRDASAHQWMRRTAVEALGYLRSPGKGGIVAKLMMKVANQKESPIDLRCAAVEALARLDLSGSGVTGAAVAETAGQVVYAACQWELDLIREQLDEAGGIRGGGTVRRPQPIGVGVGGEEENGRNGRKPKEFVADDPETVPFRRRLIHALLVVRTALMGDTQAGIPGIKKLEGAEPKSDKVVDIIDKVIAKAESGQGTMETLRNSIGVARQKVRELISTVPTSPMNYEA
jgi:hypothetical protein